MIIKIFEIEKFKKTKSNIHLIYGVNEGTKEDLINNLYIKNFDGDILKYDENKYEINVALAGIAPDQITINTVNDFLILVVRQKPLSSNQDIIHKGIQNNTIKQLFRLEQNIQVDEAELTN